MTSTCFGIAHNFLEHIRRADDVQLRFLSLRRAVANPPDLLGLHHFNHDVIRADRNPSRLIEEMPFLANLLLGQNTFRKSRKVAHQLVVLAEGFRRDGHSEPLGSRKLGCNSSNSSSL